MHSFNLVSIRLKRIAFLHLVPSLEKSDFQVLNFFFFVMFMPVGRCLFFQSFRIRSPFGNLLRVVYAFLVIICSPLQADVQLRGSLDNRCAAALQTHTTLIDSELLGYCQVQQTTNQISHIICQGFYCFLPQWICHSSLFSFFMRHKLQ